MGILKVEDEKGGKLSFVETIKKVKAWILENVEKDGIVKTSSMPLDSSGWNSTVHSALVAIQADGLEGVRISREVRWEVTDWEFVKKGITL